MHCGSRRHGIAAAVGGLATSARRPRRGQHRTDGGGHVLGSRSPVSGAARLIVGRVNRRAAAVLTALVLSFGAAGCGGGGSQTSCALDGCTITFPRSGDSTVSVLGVEARLVGVVNGAAELEVAGQQITVPVGGQADAGGFTVAVDRVTDTEVVVRVAP
jgi:hypothetical protein